MNRLALLVYTAIYATFAEPSRKGSLSFLGIAVAIKRELFFVPKWTNIAILLSTGSFRLPAVILRTHSSRLIKVIGILLYLFSFSCSSLNGNYSSVYDTNDEELSREKVSIRRILIREKNKKEGSRWILSSIGKDTGTLGTFCFHLEILCIA